MLLDQRIYNGAAEAVDIHGITADEVGNISGKLGGTLRAGTAQECAVLILFYLRAANRTLARQEVRYCIFRTLGKVNFQNFRNDLTGFSNQDCITNADIPLRDKVLIVQRGIGHRSSRQPNRSNNRLRGQNTGATHLHHNILHHSGLDFRRIFVRSRPSGELCGGAKTLTLCKIIHFDHRAVNVAGKGFTGIVDVCNLCNNFIDIFQLLKRNYLEFEAFQINQGCLMTGKFDTFRQLDIENVNIQSTLGGNLGIQLPQRTGSRISGIGKEGLPFRFLTGIELLKALLRHKDFAANDQSGRRVFQIHGDRADGFDVFCHIFAHVAVTTGSAADEFTVNVLQRHGKAVDLWLNRKFAIRLCNNGFRQKFRQFFRGKYILQAHQGYRMGNFFKLAQGFTAHTLGRRILTGKFRVSHFQFFQLTQQPVIFKVLQFGIIQHIVTVICFRQNVCQFLNSLSRIHNYLRFVDKFRGRLPR